MLPAGAHVRAVIAEAVFPNAAPGRADDRLLDHRCRNRPRRWPAKARELGFRFADAPVSGGTAGAEAGTLTFMVGCGEADFRRPSSRRSRPWAGR